jgi:serine/threonine protein kinase/tetratricopeptide (TPR) repeat protein
MGNRSQEVFESAMGLAGAEREAYVRAACGADQSLRAEVDSLLRAFERGADFLASPTVLRHSGGPSESVTADSGATATAAPIRERPGTSIGPYKLLQLIGEGGFGSVFMAQQEKPVARKVALKIIKLGMDTRQVVARFEQERQALAILDHPNIAKVLDAGATDTGRPFFVMELCTGEAIVEYCDKHKLSIEDRLELFAQVCQAVQHAHTKGIIHRDIKPSNVLVSSQDGRPHAKVIDFGIAKATASKLTEKTLFTEHRQLVGTPEYMSPEQAEGSLDIDTRTDVYSLGVLLYELLTGTTPFSNTTLRSAAYAEIQRIIREVEPPKPSTRLSNNTDTIASVAAHRHTEPKKLGSIIRGELDWIVMKALEKDRTRRYETANGLAMDIRRYLAGEAVVAAPPSKAYRFRKFFRRNRVMATAAGAVAAALLIGLAAFAWQAKVARGQRDLAVQAQQAEAEQRKHAEAAEAEARRQAAIAEAVAKFQTDMLAAVDPYQLPKDPVTNQPLKDTVTVLQAMEAAVKTLDAGSLADQPLVEAGVRDTIGNTLTGLARYADAEPNLRKSLALRRAALPAGDPDIAVGLTSLATLLMQVSRAAEAEPLFREAIEIYRAAFPAGHMKLAIALSNFAAFLRGRGDLAEAEPLSRESVAIRRSVLPAGHVDIARGLNNLGLILQDQRKLAEAEPILREALALWRAGRPAGHPDISIALNNLAAVLQGQNNFTEAEALLRESVTIKRAAFPAGHPDIAIGLSTLGWLLSSQNRLEESEPLIREVLEIRRAALPAGHPEIGKAVCNLASLLKSQNKPAEAEPLFNEGLAIFRAALPAGHPYIATTLINISDILRAQNRSAEAEPLLREALAIREKSQPDAWTNSNIRSILGGALLDQNKLDEAEPLLLEGYNGMKQREAAIPAQSAVRISEALERLVRLYETTGNQSEAAAWRAKLDAARAEQGKAGAK